jgi:hypothetical protein
MVQHGERTGWQENRKIIELQQESCYLFEQDVDSVDVYS